MARAVLTCVSMAWMPDLTRPATMATPAAPTATPSFPAWLTSPLIESSVMLNSLRESFRLLLKAPLTTPKATVSSPRLGIGFTLVEHSLQFFERFPLHGPDLLRGLAHFHDDPEFLRRHIPE